MRPSTSPLLGYNTNIRHKGKLYHIQTEDSGVQRPHIITHLFADGGRIVASSKTDYAQQLGSDSLVEWVKAKMQEQHKAMLIALRDGRYDTPDATPAAASPAPAPAPARPPIDVDALERAARAKLSASAAFATRAQKAKPAEPAPSPPRAQAKKPPAPPPRTPTQDTSRAGPKPRNKPQTLDDVIRSYLEDEREPSTE